MQPRHQRFIVLLAVFALHAAIIAFFLMYATTTTPKQEPATTIALIAVDAERPAAAQPPPPALPAKIAKTFVPIVEISIPAESESDAPAGASAACSTISLILDALLLNPAAIEAVRNAPPEARSVADAIAIWNVGWAPTTLAPSDPLFVVRASIERSLWNVADNCLDEVVAGPRLIPIPDASGERTIFLVFGSGSWNWRSLLTDPPLVNSQSEAAVSTYPEAP